MTDKQLPVFTIEDLEKVTGLDLPAFTREDAVDLGILAVQVIRERSLNLCVRVTLGDETIFRANLGTTGAANDPWLEGKVAIVRHFNEPSLLVRRRLEAEGATVQDKGLDPEIYRAAGGSVPIRVADEIVGTITVSGEPDVVDHDTVLETLRRYQTR